MSAAGWIVFIVIIVALSIAAFQIPRFSLTTLLRIAFGLAILTVGIVMVVSFAGFPSLSDRTATDCARNLRLINDAKEMWALDRQKKASEAVSKAEVQGYLMSSPLACAGGGKYEYGNVNEDVRCTLHSPPSIRKFEPTRDDFGIDAPKSQNRGK